MADSIVNIIKLFFLPFSEYGSLTFHTKPYHIYHMNLK